MSEILHKKDESTEEKPYIEEDKSTIEKEEKAHATPKSMKLLVSALVVLVCTIGVIGFFVVKKAFAPTSGGSGEKDQVIEEILPEVDASVQVALAWSKSKDNTLVLTVFGMESKFIYIGYELQYESGGVGKGVTSGSKPIEVTGLDTFEREIYLGTCSKNVCKPDTGVTKVGLVLEFSDTDGKKSQFSKEFEL